MTYCHSVDFWEISQLASGSAREDGVKMAAFPVWVGSLSLDVREHVLHNFFHKFGPIKNIVILKDSSGKSKQCGFVNFMSQEAAETAAKEMDGCEVLGQAIKTKGPGELLATGKSTTFVPTVAANSDKRDCKGLTDCVFFTEKRECFPKSGEVSLFMRIKLVHRVKIMSRRSEAFTTNYSSDNRVVAFNLVPFFMVKESFFNIYSHSLCRYNCI